MKKKYFTEEERKEAIRKNNKKCYENHKEEKIEYRKEYYENNKEEIKEYNKNHKEEKKEYTKERYEENKEKILKQVKEYYKNHREEKLEYGKEYSKNHREEIRKYKNNRLKTDINSRLAHNLRVRYNQALNRNWKIGSAVKDLGCTIPELRIYLEKLFKQGMSWDNWGKYGWHIDHIKPLSKFDLSNREEFLQACYYMNLQPLWAEDNFIKGNRLA